MDQILRDLVCPFLESSTEGVRRAFFERHYAGGPHVRVRFLGDQRAVDRAADEFRNKVDLFLGSYPSSPLENYSAERAREMMEAEGQLPAAGELEYRVNCAIEAPYRRREPGVDPTPLTRLLETFLHDCTPIVNRILHSPSPKIESALRIFFAQADLAGQGYMCSGAVAFRAHWEGFAGLMQNRKLIDRIRRNYVDQKQTIGRLLAETIAFRSGSAAEADGIVSGWSTLIRSHEEYVAAALNERDNLGFTPVNADRLEEDLNGLKGRLMEPSIFLDALLGNGQLFTAFSRQPALLRVRILTNFLYCLVANLGLTLLERMSLCYFSYVAIEEHFQCDLTEGLKGIIRNYAPRSR